MERKYMIKYDPDDFTFKVRRVEVFNTRQEAQIECIHAVTKMREQLLHSAKIDSLIKQTEGDNNGNKRNNNKKAN